MNRKTVKSVSEWKAVKQGTVPSSKASKEGTVLVPDCQIRSQLL